MAKFIVEIHLDGYDSEEEMEEACEEFIHEQLNFSGSSVTITKILDPVAETIKSFRWENDNMSQKEIKEKYEDVVKRVFQEFENKQHNPTPRKYL